MRPRVIPLHTKKRQKVILSSADCKNEEHWFAMRVVGYRVDNVVRKRLDEVGIRYFQPMHEVIRRRGEKVKKELVPVVGGLFFTYGLEPDILQQCAKCDGKLQFIYPRGYKITDRIIIPNVEMENFIRVAGANGSAYLTAEEADRAIGKKVRIHGGTFDGVEGKLVSKGRGKTLIVEIGVMAVSAKVAPEVIELIE